MRNIVVCKDSAALGLRCADMIVAQAQAAIAARGKFFLALTGGSSPEQTYKLLAQEPHKSQMDWANTFVFLSDERCVPFSDERSNFGQAKRLFIDHVPLPPANVLPIPTDAGTPPEIAERYAAAIAASFDADPNGPPPAFDLILLGLGPDGHCASLFPGKPTLEEDKLWITSSTPGTTPPPVDRVTFTFPLLNAARAVTFLVDNGKKAALVQDILEDNPPVTKHPSVGVQPAHGELTWLLTEAAASELSPQTRA